MFCFYPHGRYKTQDEQKAERRSYFTEREVPVKGADVVDHPVAPPRTKHRRQTLQEFRKLNSSDKKKSFSKNDQNNINDLFQSEHRTDDGKDLLPVRKTIAFDCHYGFLFEENNESVSRVNSAQDVLVLIKGIYILCLRTTRLKNCFLAFLISLRTIRMLIFQVQKERNVLLTLH